MMEQSYMSFDTDPAQFRTKRLIKERGHAIHEGELALIQQKHKALYTTVERVREANIILKREIIMMAENIREEFRQRQKSKTQRIQTILQTLDSKVLFVVQSCDKYITRMNHELSKQSNSKNKDEHDRQMILNKCGELTERLLRLQQRAQIFKNNEEELKRQLEAMHQRNIVLTQQLNMLSARSNQKLQQMDGHFRQKVQEFRRRETELIRREELLKKEIEKIEHIQKSVSQPTLQVQKAQIAQQIPNPQMLNPSMQNPQMPSTITPPMTPANPNAQYFQPPTNPFQKINQNFKKPTTSQQNRVVHFSTTTEESVITVLPPETNQQKASKPKHNNAIEIKPDFFRNTTADSQLSKISEMPEIRGIHLKSLNREEVNGINVKKLKESADQSEIEQISAVQKNRSKRSDSHRFDYLLNNLAATQQESTQIFSSQQRYI